MANKEHVPETKNVKPNREQRRHPEKFEHPEDEHFSRSTESQQDILEDGADDDVSVRAKSSGHGKKTADKWNQ